MTNTIMGTTETRVITAEETLVEDLESTDLPKRETTVAEEVEEKESTITTIDDEAEALLVEVAKKVRATVGIIDEAIEVTIPIDAVITTIWTLVVVTRQETIHIGAEAATSGIREINVRRETEEWPTTIRMEAGKRRRTTGRGFLSQSLSVFF